MALAVCVAAGSFVNKNVMELITTDLITFFGIQAAVILPAMIFTAGVLRPEGLRLSEVKRYGQALQKLMIFWIVLLAFDFTTVVLLIVGKATDWMSSIPWRVSVNQIQITASSTLITVVAFFGAWALLRTISFARGVLSLQQLNTDLTEKAVASREDAATAASSRASEEAQPFRSPEGLAESYLVTKHDSSPPVHPPRPPVSKGALKNCTETPHSNPTSAATLPPDHTLGGPSTRQAKRDD